MALPRILLKRGYDYLQRKFRESVILHTLESETVNSHSQKTSVYVESNQKAIVYNTNDDITDQPFSELRTGEYIFLFKSNVTIARHDIVEYNSNYYKIDRIEPLPTKGGSVGKVAYTILGTPP